MPDRPDEDAERLLRVIEAAWHQAQQDWRDDMAGRFDRVHWAPVIAESRLYLRALRECLDIMNTAERDTDF